MDTYEFIDNIFQIITVLVCVIFGNIIAKKHSKFTPLQFITGAFTCIFIGNLFWTLYYMIKGEFAYNFSVADMAYMLFYIFLISIEIIFLKEYKENNKIQIKHIIISFIPPLIIIINNAVCYLLVGGLFYNLLYCIPLSILGYYTYLNFLLSKSFFVRKYHCVVLIFLFANNMMFLTSSFMINSLYIAFDLLVTSTCPLMLYTLKKEAQQ